MAQPRAQTAPPAHAWAGAPGPVREADPSQLMAEAEATRKASLAALFGTETSEGRGVWRAGRFNLILDPSSNAGLKGVCYDPKRGGHKKSYEARGPAPEEKFLGWFATAVEAAVAYAQHVGDVVETAEEHKEVHREDAEGEVADEAVEAEADEIELMAAEVVEAETKAEEEGDDE